MPPELSPWGVILPFVAALATVIIVVLRGLTSGRIVVGRHYDDARTDEAAWRKAAETALTANVEMTSHVARLVAAVEQLTATTRETQQLVRVLVAPDHRSAV